MAGRCTGAHLEKRAEIPLPVLDAGAITGGKVHASRNGRRRAAVLILLHLLMIAHVVQWKLTGRTISPIEPSETVYTLTQGFVNAGVIFFALALLATLVLGRFVCGWGCHVVALQDLCAWMMKKVGVRPKPFRSRLLVWVPLLAALYMFVWPIAFRAWRAVLYDEPALPKFTSHLTTTDFWQTFPGFAVAVPFLLICGFGAVYFLGSKGFCTYGCPYGGFFGLADKLAVGRIRVTDACEGCGHCTAVCTSNVKVHAEVRDYGMVIDPGCMKCMDCVSVCPNEALYFGFGPPAVGVKLKNINVATPKPSTPRYDLTVKEELLAATAFAASFFAFRGLYGLIPFLMALGMAGIFAFWIHKGVRLFRERQVLIQTIRLKSAGRLTGLGRIFAGAALLSIVLVGHSLYIQYHSFRGDYYFQQTPPEATVMAPDYTLKSQKHAVLMSIIHARRHFEFCERWGLLTSVETRLRLAWLHLAGERPSEALHYLTLLVRSRPEDPKLHFYQGLVYQRLEKPNHEPALRAFNETLRLDSASIEARFHRGVSLAALHELEKAVADWHAVVQTVPNHAHAWHNLGGALRQLGRLNEAWTCFEKALVLTPDDPATHFFAAVTLTQWGRDAEGLDHFQRAVDLDPGNAEYRYQLALSLADSGRHDEADVQMEKAEEIRKRRSQP